MIKNKRLILWAYIWRYLLSIIGIGLIIYFGVDYSAEIINGFLPSTQKLLESEQLIDATIIVMQKGIISNIINIILFVIWAIIGTKIIHKIANKKVAIEKQNKKYIKRSVCATLSAIIIGFICYSTYNIYINNRDLPELEEKLVESTVMSEMMLDYYKNTDVFEPSSRESTISSLELNGTNYEDMIPYLNKGLILNIVTILIEIILIIYLNVANISNINKIAIDDTLDENGNIVPTQEKIKKKYKIIYIVTHAIILVALAIILVIKLFNNDSGYERPKRSLMPREHILVEEYDKDSGDTLFNKYYTDKYGIIIRNYKDEIDDNNEIESGDDEKEVNNEIESGDDDIYYWITLDKEKDWYLKNDITMGEAYKWINVYNELPEYVAQSKEKQYDEIKKIISTIDMSKTIPELEEQFEQQFIYFFNYYLFIPKDKNFLTGVGIRFDIDQYSNLSIKNIEVWSMSGNYRDRYANEIEYKNAEKTDVNIKNEISNLYADMTQNDFIKIFGENYKKESTNLYSDIGIYELDEYIWYDKNRNKLQVIFSKDVIYDIYYYEFNEDI